MSDKTAIWRSRVAGWRASGQTAEAFAAEQGLAVGTLRWWSSRLRRQEQRPAVASAVRLARVVRDAGGRANAPSARGGMVIELRDVPVRITIDGPVDRQALATVLAVLQDGAR